MESLVLNGNHTFYITTKPCPTRWGRLHRSNDAIVSRYKSCLQTIPFTPKEIETIHGTDGCDCNKSEQSPGPGYWTSLLEFKC